MPTVPSPSLALPENAVRAQFANPPPLTTVARQMLAAAIAQRYPSLRISLERTRLAVPRPGGGWSLEPFMPRVLDYLGSGVTLDLSPVNTQPYYLTDNAPDWLKPDDGELDMQVIESLVKELPWRLPVGLQNALHQWWTKKTDTGTSRWRWLSDVMRDTLTIGAIRQTGLNPAALAAINQVITTPDLEERIRLYGENAVRAYWLEATLLNPEVVYSGLNTRIALVTRNQVLMCKADGDTLTFKSMATLGQAWARKIISSYTVKEIRMKQFELEGNFFDASAAAILNRQLERTATLKVPSSIGWQALQRVYRSITDTSAYFADAPKATLQSLTTVKNHLPEWLNNASAASIARYRHYSLALYAAKQASEGKTYLYGISDIHTYAADALHWQMRADQRQFEQDIPMQERMDQFAPNDIELTFLSATGLPGTIGIVESTTMSLTELSLKNLIGRPEGALSLRHRLGEPLPGWLTPDYITRRGGLIEKVDIGRVYPKYLENALLSNTPDALVRERFFATQTSVQLPMEALELSLKKQNGLTPLGARHVAAVVHTCAAEQQVEGLAVVIRHLALLRHPEALPDIVGNMFIIEPANVEYGPHVLYRPFYSPSLLEFSTRDALLDAIVEPSPLQTSVLTWLSDIARPIYDNGGFKEPHYLRFGFGSEFAPIERPGPARLATNGSDELLQFLQNGQLMQYLFGCNARALVEQANTDSVSNTESRWGVLLEGGSLIFNSLLLLPGLPPPIMLTGGLLSVAKLASQDIPALASSDAATRELAAADVLLNLGMLLFHQSQTALQKLTPLPEGLMSKALRAQAPARIAEIWPEPEPPKIVTGIVALPGELPGARSTELDLGIASASDRLTASRRELLASFKVARPETLPPPIPDGLFKGLYLIDQKWHALLGEGLYPVHIDSEDNVAISSSTDINRIGPNLRTDGKGNWFVDTRLRLQAGGLSRRIASLQAQKARRKSELQTQLTDFYPLEAPRQKAVDITHSALRSAMADPRFTAEQLAALRERLKTALHAELSGYQALLATAEERSKLDIPFHETIVISMLEKSFDNRIISLVVSANEQRALINKWPQFNAEDADIEAAVQADPQGYAQSNREQVAINEITIERIEQRDGYLEQLYNFGEAGIAAATELARSIPAAGHTSLTLKGFQLDCLKQASSTPSASSLTEESLDSAIDPLNEHTHTHNQLNTLEIDADKRLEVLDSLVENYGQALDALEGIGLMYADELDPEYFKKLRLLLTELYQDVTRQLAAEIKPPPQPPAQRPGKRTPPAAGSRSKKVIHVRGKGKLIGELRPADNEWLSDVIEIRSDYDEQLLSTYLQHEDEWIEIKTVRTESPRTRALNIIKGDARKLYALSEWHLHKATVHSMSTRYPQEVEEELIREANKLDKLATELHLALQTQAEDSRSQDDQTLIDSMRSAAQKMIREGREMRIKLSFELPPTHGNLQYLIDEKQVQIAGLGKRIPLTGERQDYMQEYAVNDRQGSPLWYAHFHYDEAHTPKANYTAAHLKTKEQRKFSYIVQLDKAKTAPAIVNVHRGQIGKDLAERWFLPLAD